MKTIVILKAYCKPPELLEGGEAYSKYLDEFILFWEKDKTSYPESLLDLRYAESHVDSDNHMRVYYTDMDAEHVRSALDGFASWFLKFEDFFPEALSRLGLLKSELKDGWEDALTRREKPVLRYSFGEWREFHGALEFCEDGNFNVAEAEKSFYEFLLDKHGELLRKIKDWMLSFIEVSSIEEFACVLNRFSCFPIKYFSKVCDKFGWNMKRLDFGEMCSDGVRTLCLGYDGKVFVK